MSDTRKNDLFCGDLFADDMLDCENAKIDDNANNNADNNLYNQNKDLFFTLIDASGFIFRAFYAMKMLNSPDGVPVNAVYGYCSMLLRIIEDKLNGEDVHHQEVILPVFDSARKNFRMDLYDNYKANRAETPPDLIPQFPLIREATIAFGLPVIQLEGFEADDIIASYANNIAEIGGVCRIISSDKDLMQLVNDEKNIFIFDPAKNKIIREQQVFEKFGVYPDKVVDIQALIGDSVDNISGVPSIGPKGAADLINEFNCIENLYDNLHLVKNEKRRDVLSNYKENAFISKQLAALKKDIDLPLKLHHCNCCNINFDSLLEFCDKLNFHSIINRIQKLKNRVSTIS